MNFNTDLAAKTGTTQGYGDAWLVGYNPNVSLGVWLGYKDRTRSLYYGLERQTLHPTTRTSMLFARIMNAANEVNARNSRGLLQNSSGLKVSSQNHSVAYLGLHHLLHCSSAGLVKSDLFNSKVMLPTEPDDSITSSSYVSVKGTRYLALPSTPSRIYLIRRHRR